MKTIPENTTVPFANLAEAARAASAAALAAAAAFENLAAEAAKFENVLGTFDNEYLRRSIVVGLEPQREAAREAVRAVRTAQSRFGEACDAFSPPNKRAAKAATPEV